MIRPLSPLNIYPSVVTDPISDGMNLYGRLRLLTIDYRLATSGAAGLGYCLFKESRCNGVCIRIR